MVFSDLDGCLLDETTFDHAPADGMLHRLREEGIPLVLVSSKTRAEIEHLRSAIDHSGPYSSENGALVVDGAARSIYGRPSRELLGALSAIAAEADALVEPLCQMAPDRVKEVTGLAGAAADRAMQREFSQPFLVRRGSAERIVERAESRDLRIIRGRRLLHLGGRHDKGFAVRRLRPRGSGSMTIGIGDGPNDIELLHAVDVPVWLGKSPPGAIPDNTLVEEMTGPEGWSRALGRVLDGGQDG
jgi:mannosyl-3-phosphoglycerate phosphatase